MQTCQECAATHMLSSRSLLFLYTSGVFVTTGTHKRFIADAPVVKS